jgi:ABC-type sugar transport system permease subunit
MMMVSRGLERLFVEREKGSMIDLIIPLIAILVLVFSGFIGYKIMTTFQANYINATNATGGITPEENKAMNASVGAINTFNNLIPVILVMLVISSVVLAALIPVSPVFLPFSILLGAFYILLSTVFSNAVWAFITNPTIYPVAQSYPLIATIAQYLPWLVAIHWALLAIVMYSRPGGSSGVVME